MSDKATTTKPKTGLGERQSDGVARRGRQVALPLLSADELTSGFRDAVAAATSDALAAGIDVHGTIDGRPVTISAATATQASRRGLSSS